MSGASAIKPLLCARAAAIASAAVGSLVLAGWALNSGVLKSIVPGLATMKANTALAFVLSGAALWLLRDPGAAPWARRGARACAFLVLAIGALTLAQYASGRGLGIDQLLFKDVPGARAVVFPGRPSAVTALTLVLIGLSLLLLDVEMPRGTRPAEWTALLAGFIALLALVGYGYDVQSLYRAALYSPMAVHTAATFVVLAAGILCARPAGLVAILAQDSAGGVLARRLLPAAILIPSILGWLRLKGQQAGLYGTEFGLALFATSNMVVFTALIWTNAASLHRADGQRRQAQDALRRANLDLEDRVMARTAELARLNEALRAEVAERAKTEGRFRSLFESAPDAIVIVDGDGRIVLVNSQAEAWFGYGRGELQGLPVEVLVPERSRARHPRLREGYVADAHARPMGSGLDLYGRRRDGTEFPVEISLSPIETSEGILVTSIVRDITKRKRVEAERFALQQRYRQLVNNLPIGVYRNTPGPQGRFLEVNPAIVAMFGADSAEDLLRCPVNEFYASPGQRAAFNDRLMKDGVIKGEELELRTLKGRKFWASVTAVRKADEAGSVYFDGVIEDVSDRKQAEQQIRELNDTLQHHATELEAVNKELEAFSHSVSHDLRAPLRAIDGFSRVLLEDYARNLDADGRDSLQRIRAGAQRMGMLIDDLLALSRVTRSELRRENIDLSLLAQEVAATLGQAQPERQVEFRISPGMVTNADPRLLRIALENLLGNAWKFTARRDQAVIEVGVADQGDKRPYFVRDNGVGFDMTYVHKLFGAFQRLHDARDFPGTGIGLATVQRIVHRHGGRIWAEGAADNGATFYFTL